MMKDKMIRMEDFAIDAYSVIVITDKSLLRLDAPKGKIATGYIRSYNHGNRLSSFFDLRDHLGIISMYHNQGKYLKEILDDKQATASMIREKEKDYIVVKYQYATEIASTINKYELWYDVDKNGVIYKKIKDTISDEPYASIHGEETVDEYVEPLPGLFLPKKISLHSRAYMKTSNEIRQKAHGVMTFENYQINPDLPDSLFQLTFPPGAQVFDEVNKKIWKVLDDGSLAPLKKDGQEVTMNQAELSYATNDPRSLLGPTRAEPGSGGLWFILGGLALLLLAVGYWLWQKRRERLEAS